METTFADSEMWGWALLCVPAEILTEKVSRKAVIPRNFLPGKFSDYAVIICLHCRGTICGHSVKGLLRDNMYMYINVHQGFIQSGGGGGGGALEYPPPPPPPSPEIFKFSMVFGMCHQNNIVRNFGLFGGSTSNE